MSCFVSAEISNYTNDVTKLHSSSSSSCCSQYNVSKG